MSDTDLHRLHNSDLFRSMAAKIDLNSEEWFSGAAVIVSPQGMKIEILFLDPEKNEVQFWAAIKTRAEIALNELQLREAQRTQYGMR